MVHVTCRLAAPIVTCTLHKYNRWRDLAANSDKFGNACCRPCCPIVFNIALHDLSANFLSDHCGDDLWRCLLEMVTQREREKRSLVRRQLHCCGQTPLPHRQITHGQVTVQLVHIGAHFEPLHCRGSIREPAPTTIRSSGTRCLASGKASMIRRSRCWPTPEPPTATIRP